MSDSEKKEQEKIHTALQTLLNLEEGEILTGWILSYEYMGLDDKRFAGHIYGPKGMTTWGALGLVEWSGRVSLLDSIIKEEDD